MVMDYTIYVKNNTIEFYNWTSVKFPQLSIASVIKLIYFIKVYILKSIWDTNQ